jgi:hypothetical protein
MRYTSPVQGRARTIPVKYFVAANIAFVNDIADAPDGSIRGNGLIGFGLYHPSSQGLPPDLV